MANYFIDSNTPLPVTTGPHLINLFGEETVFLASGASLVANAAEMDVINSDGSSDRMVINGSIYSAQANGLSNNSGTSKIQVGASGLVYGALAGLRLGSYISEFGQVGGSSVWNSGTIQSAGIGISTTGHSNEIVNSGRISGLAYGIKQQFEFVEGTQSPLGYGLTVRNAGIIEGDVAVEGSIGRELIENRGTIQGTIRLNEGADIYDGRFGFASGHINMGLGDDTALGGAGDETFLGQEGPAESGYGNDVYNGGGGNDTVLFITGEESSFVTVDLRKTTAQNTGYGLDTFIGIENIIIQDTFEFAIPGTILIGNNGDNILGGGLSDSTLEGGLGNDTLLGNEAGLNTARFSGKTGAVVNLNITAGQNTGYGYDKLVSIENLIGGSGKDRFTGNNESNQLRGNAGDDILSGGAGGDVLYGGTGKDTLIGGSDSDTFVFNTAIGKDVDVIKDFLAFKAPQNRDEASDLIYLSKSIFKKVTATPDPELPEIPFGKLMQKQFWIGSKAHDRDDRIIYHAKTGELFYDADGTGAQKQIKFSQLGKDLLLSHNDFLVVG